MTIANTAPRLSLVVENPQALEQGSQPRHRFGAQGGTIGSHGANWLLLDRGGHVQARHCEIRYEDGGYLVIDRCGQTTVNDQTHPLGLHASARLRNGDTLRVGPYRLAVHLDNERHHLPDLSRTLAEHDLAEFIDVSRDHLDALPQAVAEVAVVASQPAPGWAEFQALGEPPPSHGHLDPLKALDGIFTDPPPLESREPLVIPAVQEVQPEPIPHEHAAVNRAIAAGLDALRSTFTPEQLQQRYLSGELRSGQPQGFDRLFLDVFEQTLRGEVG